MRGRGRGSTTHSHCSQTIVDDGFANIGAAELEWTIGGRSGDAGVEGTTSGIEDCSVNFGAGSVGREGEGGRASGCGEGQKREDLHGGCVVGFDACRSCRPVVCDDGRVGSDVVERDGRFGERAALVRTEL